jgi:hypothetical protein
MSTRAARRCGVLRGAPYSWETLFPLIECAARQIICVPTVLFPQFTVGIGALVSVTDAHSPSLAITLYMVSTIKRKERMRQGPGTSPLQTTTTSREYKSLLKMASIQQNRQLFSSLFLIPHTPPCFSLLLHPKK